MLCAVTFCAALPVTMTPVIWLTLGVLLGVFLLLAFSNLSSDLILVAAVVVLLLAGVIKSDESLKGFSNENLVVVAVLYVVAAGMQDTGGMTLRRKNARPHEQRFLGRDPFDDSGCVHRAAFMNNTPLVAMMIPSWSIGQSKIELPFRN